MNNSTIFFIAVGAVFVGSMAAYFAVAHLEKVKAQTAR